MKPIVFTLRDRMPVTEVELAADQAAEVADFFSDFGDSRAWDALATACCYLDSGDAVRGAIHLEMAVRQINDLIEEVQA